MLGSVVLTACGGASTRPESTSRTDQSSEVAGAPSEAWTVPLTHEAATGVTLPVPMVEVVIGGHATRLIVDTGASHHAFTSTFADRAELAAIGAGEASSDHAGATFEAQPVGDVLAQVGARELELRDGYRMDAVPALEELGIGGFISPQRLAEPAAVVVDLRAMELRGYASGSDMLAAFGARSTVTELTVEWLRHKPFTTFEVDGVSVFGEIDTGSGQTEIEGSVGQVSCTGVGVSGNCVEGTESMVDTFRLAEFELTGVDVVVMEAIEHGGDPRENALLGMNVLRHCALGFAAIGAPMHVHCEARGVQGQ